MQRYHKIEDGGLSESTEEYHSFTNYQQINSRSGHQGGQKLNKQGKNSYHYDQNSG